MVSARTVRSTACNSRSRSSGELLWTWRSRTTVGRRTVVLKHGSSTRVSPRLGEQRAKLSRGNDLAKAMDYLLKRWPAFTRFLDNGRICLSNNAAERALRGIALGKKSRLVRRLPPRRTAGRAAMYSLIVTAKLNEVDPQAWLAHILARIAEHPAQKDRRTPITFP